MKCKATERNIREYLTSQGYNGRTAEVRELELITIERPGWVQIFCFSVTTKRDDGDWEMLFGLIRDDERERTTFALFHSHAERQPLLTKWSAGLIKLKRREYSRLSSVGLALFWLTFFFAIVAAFWP